MASNPSAPTETLVELAVRGTEELRRAVAYNPGSPLVLIQHLRNDEAPAVAAAAERQLAARALPKYQEVSRWPDEQRFEAAADPETDPADLEILSFGERAIRERVAANPAATPKILWRLGHDMKKSVRRAVATHPATPAQTLAHLTRDDDRFVRLAIAERKNLPAHLLARLAGDSHALVRTRVAAHKRLPPDLFTVLSADRAASVRQQLAAHKRLSVELISVLAEDPHPKVRLMIAMNRTTPEHTLAALSEDPDPSVRDHAQTRLNNAKKSRLAKERP